MKHIKFSAEAIGPDFQKVKVQILEQTHKGDYFGACGDTFKHGTTTLHSIAYPENQSGTCVTRIAMRGSMSCRDDYKLTLSIKDYTNFKAAVEAYNKTFACVPAPAVNRCATIIG